MADKPVIITNLNYKSHRLKGNSIIFIIIESSTLPKIIYISLISPK